jgi:hypothetical protein
LTLRNATRRAKERMPNPRWGRSEQDDCDREDADPNEDKQQLPISGSEA